MGLPFPAETVSLEGSRVVVVEIGPDVWLLSDELAMSGTDVVGTEATGKDDTGWLGKYTTSKWR